MSGILGPEWQAAAADSEAWQHGGTTFCAATARWRRGAPPHGTSSHSLIHLCIPSSFRLRPYPRLAQV